MSKMNDGQLEGSLRNSESNMTGSIRIPYLSERTEFITKNKFYYSNFSHNCICDPSPSNQSQLKN